VNQRWVSSDEESHARLVLNLLGKSVLVCPFSLGGILKGCSRNVKYKWQPRNNKEQKERKMYSSKYSF